MLRHGAHGLQLTLVGPEGQAVSYEGQAVPRGEGLRAFLAHGWRPYNPRADRATEPTDPRRTAGRDPAGAP
jgi:hypothetical protein